MPTETAGTDYYSDPTHPCLPGQAMLAPIFMKKARAYPESANFVWINKTYINKYNLFFFKQFQNNGKF